MMESPLLVISLTSGAVLSLLLLLRGSSARDTYLANGEAHAAHVVMNGAMALMASPLYGPGVKAVTTGLLLLAGTVLLVRFASAARASHSERAAGSLYHLIAVGVMVLAMSAMPAMTAGHAGMAMSPMHPSWLAIAGASIFALDGLATGVLSFAFPAVLLGMQGRVRAAAAGPADLSAVRDLRLAVLPHLIMDVGMVLMLV